MSKFKFFGYNGIHLNLPDAYELAEALGNQIEGQLTFDNQASHFLQIKWNKAKDIKFADLEKKLIFKKHRISEQKTLISNILKRYHFKDEQEQKQEFLLFHQSQSQRYILIHNQVHFKDEWYLEMIKPLQESYKTYIWNFFSVYFQLTSDYLLQNADLNIGLYHLNFRKKNTTLNIWVYSMADRILKQHSLQDWISSIIEQSYPKKYTINTQSTALHHCNFSGKMRWRWNFSLKQLFKSRLNITGEAFFNQKENQIFVYSQHYPKQKPPLELSNFKLTQSI